MTNYVLYKPEDTEKVFEQYYCELYSQPASVDGECLTVFLEGLDLPAIGAEQKKLLTSEITLKEVEDAISRVKSGKSPGPDGFGASYYKTLRGELLLLLLDSFNYTLRSGRVPPSWKEAIISITPKEGKDREYCGNYRPILLLHVDYKLYTSILARRLDEFMQDLIDEDECGL